MVEIFITFKTKGFFTSCRKVLGKFVFFQQKFKLGRFGSETLHLQINQTFAEILSFFQG
jgi:hypothetical protein